MHVGVCVCVFVCVCVSMCVSWRAVRVGMHKYMQPSTIVAVSLAMRTYVLRRVFVQISFGKSIICLRYRIALFGAIFVCESFGALVLSGVCGYAIASLMIPTCFP
jgi:hypothetical protein